MSRQLWLARWRFTLSAGWVGYWVLIFILTHIPIPRGMRLPSGGDKVTHVIMYALLSGAGGLAMFAAGRATLRRLLGWGVIYLAYGVVDEVTQPIVGRSASVADWVADLTGVVLGTAIMMLVVLRTAERSPRAP
jgi:VanZ family protein